MDRMEVIYGRFKEICAAHDTSITQVLSAIGRATASTGSWKAGRYPQLDTVMMIAEHLHVSLDDLCYGPDNDAASRLLTDNEREWLEIISKIPEDRQEICKDFLRTHMVQRTPAKKYLDKKNA